MYEKSIFHDAACRRRVQRSITTCGEQHSAYIWYHEVTCPRLRRRSSRRELVVTYSTLEYCATAYIMCRGVETRKLSSSNHSIAAVPPPRPALQWVMRLQQQRPYSMKGFTSRLIGPYTSKSAVTDPSATCNHEDAECTHPHYQATQPSVSPSHRPIYSSAAPSVIAQFPLHHP